MCALGAGIRRVALAEGFQLAQGRLQTGVFASKLRFQPLSAFPLGCEVIF